jgi:hypothetical protein
MTEQRIISITIYEYISSNTTYYNLSTSVYFTPSYMFRPIHVNIFRLLCEEVFSIDYSYVTTITCYTSVARNIVVLYVKHLVTQKPEDGHVDWPKHVAWSKINTS